MMHLYVPNCQSVQSPRPVTTTVMLSSSVWKFCLSLFIWQKVLTPTLPTHCTRTGGPAGTDLDRPGQTWTSWLWQQEQQELFHLSAPTPTVWRVRTRPCHLPQHHLTSWQNNPAMKGHYWKPPRLKLPMKMTDVTMNLVPNIGTRVLVPAWTDVSEDSKPGLWL